MTVHNPFPPHGSPDPVDTCLFGCVPFLVFAFGIIALILYGIGA
jgi:hypothetical protein